MADFLPGTRIEQVEVQLEPAGVPDAVRTFASVTQALHCLDAP